MNNRLKEFEELLLNNTLLKVHNQALGDRNPKWKEWWQTIEQFTKEQIQESMELSRCNEQGLQLELHAYRTTFLDFKYKPPSFVFAKNKTNSKILATPSMIQPIAITKLVSLLKGGTSLEITLLLQNVGGVQ
jgi:adenylosuccinate synthase